MPWSPSDATRHNKSVKSAHGRDIWSSTANSVLAESGDEGKAIRIANAAANKYRAKRSSKRSPKR